MSQTQDTIVAALMEQLIAEGPDGMAQVFTTLFNLAMRLERERFLGAGLYERHPDRRGYANGYKSKTLDTTAGTVTVDVPKAAGIDEPFYPQSLERGRRSSRAVMLAIAEMYVQGVSTRDVAKVMAEFGLKSLSSTQVSRAAALLDEELAAWRRRPLGEVHYLLLDARYEKLREGGVVRDAALFSAIGIGPDGRRCVLGVSCDPSEAEIHWRAFLDNLIDRGMRGVRFVVSDDHAGLKAAPRAVLPGAIWQRCQFHLAQNAIHHAPNAAIRKRIGAELRRILKRPTCRRGANSFMKRRVAGLRRPTAERTRRGSTRASTCKGSMVYLRSGAPRPLPARYLDDVGFRAALSAANAEPAHDAIPQYSARLQRYSVSGAGYHRGITGGAACCLARQRRCSNS